MPPEAFVIIIGSIITGTVCLLIFGLPFYAIWTYHKRKMEELRMKNRANIDEQTRAAIEALRGEFNALRDTTTQYDVSFDSALRRIESRMSHMEQRITSVEQDKQAVEAQRS